MRVQTVSGCCVPLSRLIPPAVPPSRHAASGFIVTGESKLQGLKWAIKWSSWEETGVIFAQNLLIRTSHLFPPWRGMWDNWILCHVPGKRGQQTCPDIGVTSLNSFQKSASWERNLYPLNLWSSISPFWKSKTNQTKPLWLNFDI